MCTMNVQTVSLDLFVEKLSYWKPVDLNVILVLSVSIIWLKQEQIFSKQIVAQLLHNKDSYCTYFSQLIAGTVRFFYRYPLSLSHFLFIQNSYSIC